MTTHSRRRLSRFQLKLAFLANYIEQIARLEHVLSRKPAELHLEIIGSGELSPDTALLIRSVLLQRSPRTLLITNARSSLQGGAVLVWLMGDTRLIREDAKLQFRRPNTPEKDEAEDDWKGEGSKDCEMDLEEADYAQLLQYINNFLPVKELGGQALDLDVLRQFGLVDNQKMDRFLASAFARTQTGLEVSQPGPESKKTKPIPKESRSDQAERQESG